MIKTAIGLLAFVIAAYMLALTVKDLVITIRLGGPTGGTAGAYSFGAMLIEGGATLLLLLLGVLLTHQHLEKRGARVVVGLAALLMVLWGMAAGYLE